jgi:hypothetical protein
MLTFIRGPATFFGPGQVYVKMLPAGEPVQLTNDNLPKMMPVFSPDQSTSPGCTRVGVVMAAMIQEVLARGEGSYVVEIVLNLL